MHVLTQHNKLFVIGQIEWSNSHGFIEIIFHIFIVLVFMFYGWELQNNKANLDVWETLSEASINGMGGDAKVSFSKRLIKLCFTIPNCFITWKGEEPYRRLI
jgi:hypothetical protein